MPKAGGQSTGAIVAFFPISSFDAVHSHLSCNDGIDSSRVGAVQCLPSTCEALGPTYRTDKNRVDSPLNGILAS